MKKLLCALTMLLMSTQCYATQISVFKTYATNDQVTAANLNGNISNIVTVVNGNLDNTNANTASGYRFFEVLGALPAAGTQGRCVFLTTANTLNFDSGTAWNSVVSATSPARGDILYYNGTAWTKLTAGTAGGILNTGGAGANPSWGGIFGAWTGGAVGGTYSDNTAYQASTDGIVIGLSNAAPDDVGYSDAANPPTTVRANATSSLGATTLIFPVRKGDYWKTTGIDDYIYFLPIGQ